MRDDHVEPVHGAALEETHQDRAATGGMGRQRLVRGEGRPRQEEWVQTETDQGQTAGLHENSSRDRHVSVLLPLRPSAALAALLSLKLRSAYCEADGQSTRLRGIADACQLTSEHLLRVLGHRPTQDL